MAVAISGTICGWCFLYLPMLLNYAPEFSNGKTASLDHDPRALNRSPMPSAVWREFVRSSRGESMRRLMMVLLDLRKDVGGDVALAASPDTYNGRVLMITRPADRVMLIVNLDWASGVSVRSFIRGAAIAGWGTGNGTLDALGFGFWRY